MTSSAKNITIAPLLKLVTAVTGNPMTTSAQNTTVGHMRSVYSDVLPR